MVGMHAARYTNLLLEECDLLIALGVRFDDRATGKVGGVLPAGEDPARRHRRQRARQDQAAVPRHRGRCGPVPARPSQPLIAAEPRSDWISRAQQLRAGFPLAMPGAGDPLQPYGIVRHVAALADDDAIVTSDVGQHQMWVGAGVPLRAARASG